MNLRPFLALLVASGGVSLAAPHSGTSPGQPSLAAHPATGLHFLIRDARNQPVPFACVRLALEGTALTAGPLCSNADGEAQITSLPAGRWHWTISAAALGTVEGCAAVQPGQRLRVEARLDSPAAAPNAGPTLDFGPDLTPSLTLAGPAVSGRTAASEKIPVASESTAPVLQERDPASNGDGRFSLPATRTLANTLPGGKPGSLAPSTPFRSAATLVLADFGGAPSNGAALPGTTWDGAAVQTGGLLVVGAEAKSEQGWGWTATNSGQYLDLSAFNTVTVTAQQTAGNAAGNFSLLFFDPNENFTFVTLSMSSFLGGMQSASGTLSWGSVDAGKISKWTLGGDFPFSNEDFRLSINGIELTTAVPEPSTYAALAGASALAFAWWRRRRI